MVISVLVIPGSLHSQLGSAWNHQFTVERASALRQTLQTPANIMESSPRCCTASVSSDCVSGNLTVITAWKSVCHRTLGQRSWILQQDCLSPHPQMSPTPLMRKVALTLHTYTHTRAHTQRWAVGGGGVSPVSQLTQCT